MSDDSRPPLTPGQRLVRNGLAWLLEAGARAGSRFVESLADDVAKEAERKRKAAAEWRVTRVGDHPGDMGSDRAKAEEEFQ